MWGGLFLSIVWMIFFEIIGINGGIDGYIFNVGTTLIVAGQWEIWRSVPLKIWSKLKLPVSKPDWNDLLATMILSWIVPLLNFSAAYE
jgi:hypothetical protein